MAFLRRAPTGAVCLLCVLLPVVTSAPACFASTSSAASGIDTAAAWREPVRALWMTSPDVQAARADLEAARARARAADQPLYNPVLAIDAENADVNRRTAQLSLTLDVSGKRRARTSRDLAELHVAQAAYDMQRQSVAQRWLKACSAVSLATRQRELGQQRVALMQRFDDLAAERLRLGDISSPERDLAGLALGEAQVHQATLAGNEAANRAALLALAVNTQAIASPPWLRGLPPSEADVVAHAVEDLPQTVQAQSRAASAEAAIQIAQRNQIPDPTVSLTGGRVRAGPVTDHVIGVSVSIPLPVLNNGRAEVDAARADADAAIASLQAERLRARATLQEAQARYEALRHAAASFQRSRAAAFQQRTVLLEKLWRAGEISTSDYLVQLKQSLDTALSGFELENQTWQAWFDYLTAAGRLNDWIDGRAQETAP
ncbi:TolC family protein [Dyella choica]|uniref:TolC family protein n=1 Tax=Dyella choica TaxID=1927959 RepID=A0A432MBE2_9GAMM|nr:TolC family protein [Dyella choica]RUL79041.1 TolC family protein [Dyella choica]